MKKKDGRQKDINKNGGRKKGMGRGRYAWGGRFGMLLAGMALAMCILAGCGISEEGGYAQQESNDLAKLEIYEAKSGELLKTIEEEETLYQYNQLLWLFEGEWEAETEYYETETEYYETETEELKEKVKEAQETYHISIYKRPVAKFGDKEPVKTLTVTLYENTDIVKIKVLDESNITFFIPEESLTFYYEMSTEESDFYASLID